MAEWHPDTIERLRTLWDDEGLSSAEIGRRLGKSKNAVVGKAHRLGLPSRESPIIRNGAPTPPKPKRVHVKAVTLQQFRFCIQCGGTLGAEQEKFCTATCEDLHGLAALARKVPERRKSPAPEPAVETTFGPLPSHPCAWPIGEPGTKKFKFCEATSLPKKPYCEIHARIAYVKIRDLRDEAIPATPPAEPALVPLAPEDIEAAA